MPIPLIIHGHVETNLVSTQKHYVARHGIRNKDYHRNLDTAVQHILRVTGRRALSSSQVTDQLDVDYSRPSIDRTLRRLAGKGTIGRVELGPSVGYYLEEDPIQRMGDWVEGIEVSQVGWSAGVPCIECEQSVVDGDSFDLVFEWLPDHWAAVEGICPDCRERVTSATQLLPAENIVAAGEHGSDYATVRGLLEEREMEQEDRL